MKKTKRYKQNILNLSFIDKNIEKEYRRVNQKKGLIQTRLAVSLGLGLYFLFSLLDIYILEIITPVTLSIRLLIVPLFFIIGLILTFRRKSLLAIVNLMVLISAQLGHFVLIATGLFPAVYSFGITYIILLYLFTFSRIEFKKTLFIVFIIVVIFQGLSIFLCHYTKEELLIGNFFLLSILLVSILAGYTTEKHLRREFISQKELSKSKQKTEELLLNILPRTVAQELKERGIARPVHFKDVSVLFTDFVNFTSYTDKIESGPLIASLDKCFSYFDERTRIFNLEKIKTIGDSYMLAGGLPLENKTHPVECILAGMTFLEYVQKERETLKGDILLPEIRIGIHTGPVTAGVLGSRKFAYDIFGRTVNIASRVESCGEKSRINISESTYNRVKDFFVCTKREIHVDKNGESHRLFGIKGLKPEFSQAGEGINPNMSFWRNLHSWNLETHDLDIIEELEEA